MSDIQATIEQAFEQRSEFTPDNAPGEVRDAVQQALAMLDSGAARVAERRGIGDWEVNEWLKKAVLLSFRLTPNRPIDGGLTRYYDKVGLKFADWSEEDFRAGGMRVVPPAVARHGSYVAPDVVLMPSYVNIGA